MARPNERIQFWRGYSTAMNSVDILSGQILFQEDTGDVFLDYRETHPTLPGSNEVNPNYGQLIRLKLTDTDKANIYGDTFTGQVFLFPEYTLPIEDNEAVPKKYVDDIEQDLQTQIDEHVNNQEIHITQKEREAWNNKVDKEEGKGLSTNDFTDELKEKVERSTHVEYQSSYTVDEDNIDEFYDLGTISIDDTVYHIYAPVTVDIAGNAGSADKLKDPVLIDGLSFDGSIDLSRFGVCNSLEEDPNKVVHIDNFELIDSALILVYFSISNIAENVTLDVSNTGAYPIYYQGLPIDPKLIDSNYYNFIFRDDTIFGGFPRYELVSGVDTTYDLVTYLSDGLMSKEDKEKLDGIEDNANNYTLPPATDYTLGGVIVGDNISVDNSGTISLNKSGVESALGFHPLNPDEFNFEDFEDLVPVMEGATESYEFENPYGVIEVVPAKDGEKGLVPKPTVDDVYKVLSGSGTWVDQVTYSIFSPDVTGPDGVEPGDDGLVPHPGIDDMDKVLSSDGTWKSIDSVAVTRITEEEIKKMLDGLDISIGSGSSCNCQPISEEDIKNIVNSSQVQTIEAMTSEEITSQFNSIFGGSNA